jgi:hypothetical protein
LAQSSGKATTTPFRSTNVQVIKAESASQGAGGTSAPSNSLFDYVVDDVCAGTVQAYTVLDIILDSMVHPESPKLIKMGLAQLDMEGTPDLSIEDIIAAAAPTASPATFDSPVRRLLRISEF